MSSSQESSIGPLEAFWRFRSWTVPVTIVVGILAALGALAVSGDATAETTLYLTDPRGTPLFTNSTSNPTDLSRYARQRANFAESATVRAAVAESLAGLDAEAGNEPETAASLENVISADTTASSDVMITCVDPDPDRAVRICNQTVAAYISLTNADTQARAESTVGALNAERDRLIAANDNNSSASTINAIELRIAEIRSEAALFGAGIEFVDPPELVESSRLRPAVQFGIAGLLFAAFVTAALAWFRAGRRPVITTSAEAGGLLRAPVLGEIVGSDVGEFNPASPPGAEYQFIATSVGAVRPEGGVILTATARPHPEMTEAVARLAIAAGREGRRVAVIDGNLRDRSITTLFGIDRSSLGLTETLAGLTEPLDVCQSVGVGGQAVVDVIAGGRGVDDPASLFRSQQARAVLRSLSSEYDLVLVDVPPILTAADGAALASGTEGALLFVQRDEAKSDLETVRQRFGVLRVPLVGVVFDRRSREQSR